MATHLADDRLATKSRSVEVSSPCQIVSGVASQLEAAILNDSEVAFYEDQLFMVEHYC